MSIFRLLTPALTTVALCATLSACGGGGSSSDPTVINESKVLRGGTTTSYALDAGTYTVEVTSSNMGVLVEWLGSSNCVGSHYLTRLYKERCTMHVGGQVVIKNPVTVGSQTVVINGTTVTLSNNGTGSTTINGVPMSVSYSGNNVVTINGIPLTLSGSGTTTAVVNNIPITVGVMDSTTGTVPVTVGVGGGDQTITVKILR